MNFATTDNPWPFDRVEMPDEQKIFQAKEFIYEAICLEIYEPRNQIDLAEVIMDWN